MISAFSSCAEMNRSGGRICSHQQLLARHLPVEWTLQIRFARDSPRASCISCPSLVPSLPTITDHCFEVWEMEGFPHLLAVITPSFQRLHILHSSQGMTDTVWTSSPCEIAVPHRLTVGVCLRGTSVGSAVLRLSVGRLL